MITGEDVCYISTKQNSSKDSESTIRKIKDPKKKHREVIDSCKASQRSWVYTSPTVQANTD